MRTNHIIATMLSVSATIITNIPAHAQNVAKIADQHQASVARMLHSRTDFSWLFDPILLDHIELTASDAHDARQVVELANAARAQGLADRTDVRAARAAAEDVILAEALRRSLVDSISPGDDRIAQRIAAQPGRYDEYRLRHIFIAVGPTRDGKSRSEADALTLARQVRARIMAGERFETVAEAVSEDRSTAVDGGVLSALLGTTMDDAFFPHVRTLPIGGITEPVRGPQGFHILKLDARQPATTASARYWVEQDIVKERLPVLIAQAVASGRKVSGIKEDTK